jgi:phosphoribosylformylglycinamidine synthase
MKILNTTCCREDIYDIIMTNKYCLNKNIVRIIGGELHMTNKVFKIFVEKKPGFNVEAANLLNDIKISLDITCIKSLRIINCYFIMGITAKEYKASKDVVFHEPAVDFIYEESFDLDENSRAFAYEYLPGQYDQRADSAAQCLMIITQNNKPEVKFSRLIIIDGNISGEEFESVKKYCINPVDSHETSIYKENNWDTPFDIHEKIDEFPLNEATEEDFEELKSKYEFAMNIEDLKFCRDYFKNNEKRNPTVTEIRVIDTYWSDHCRHTTFMTELLNVEIEEGIYNSPLKKAYGMYIDARKSIHTNIVKDKCLMDIATIAMKELKGKGLLNDLDESEEINACSIEVPVNIDGNIENWLVMFKNETHNHPTEIEPFGGAATCLGGAIRDPLSGRAYVYQAMRITGSGDPRSKIADTLTGKIPQKKITVGAAQGYSSYGNQIGLATGLVHEIYDEGYIAKRMEIGAVIAAVPKKNVVRETPLPGDIVILIGGRTGRDGCGGATGSSKEHTEESIVRCGAEVQKGNAPTERKIQRLFRNPEVSTMIKRCNDFGAGGVSVAIGELTDGLNINLDLVPKKYEGLDGTELAISESQERMAVVVSKKNSQSFIKFALEENLEATIVAEVIKEKRLRMFWKGRAIVDISREFLNTNGIKQKTDVLVKAPVEEKVIFNTVELGSSLKENWLNNLKQLNVCSQKGLVERFDSTIGAGTILMPFGGKYQLTPEDVMAAKIPVLNGETSTGTLMSYGGNPKITTWSPFHGAVFAVVEAVAKIAAAGGDYSKVRLTLQEYFEKPGNKSERWGKPFGALLGAYTAQIGLGVPAIGGKDSMSGTFKDKDVPPTLVCFAVGTIEAGDVISSEFKKSGSNVILVKASVDNEGMPDFEELKNNFNSLKRLYESKNVLSARSVGYGGISEAVSKMSFGNRIGFQFNNSFEKASLYSPLYGSVILELKVNSEYEEALKNCDYEIIGHTTEEELIEMSSEGISLDEAISEWMKPLESIFPTKTEKIEDHISVLLYSKRSANNKSSSIVKPKVLIPVFPGTNCEYDSKRAFEKAGGNVKLQIVRNLTPEDIKESLKEMVKEIEKSQIIMFPGGFSAGDEPDGSGKFIAAFFRNPEIKEAVMEFLNNRDGLMLGICNGFQALIKLGLLPFGEIRDMTENYPTLTYNSIGRHVSKMVDTKVISTLSPWFANVEVGDVHVIPVSHGEGRFYAQKDVVEELLKNGQVATQYVDHLGCPTYDVNFNPNGSMCSVESITSPDGRILGKMGHSERIGLNIAINIPGNKNQKLFESGISYFK